MAYANPLDALPLTQALQENAALFAAVETVHTIGFVVLVGSAVMFDLRVLGLTKSIPVTALARHLLPWSWGSLLVIVPSGLVLFLANSSFLLASKPFQLKMALLLTAGVNAVAFLTGPYQSVKAWDTGASAPAAAKASVAASLVLWVAILACGRFLAYA